MGRFVRDSVCTLVVLWDYSQHPHLCPQVSDLTYLQRLFHFNFNSHDSLMQGDFIIFILQTKQLTLRRNN